MENLRKIYNALHENEKFREVISQAKEKFEVKPFVQEHYKLKKIIQVLHPVLSLFSIVTGFGFLAYQFANGLNFWIASFFALVLLVFLELLKSEFSAMSFKRLFVKSGNSSLNYSLLFFTLAFFGLSVFLSVNGAKELYKQLDKSEIDFKGLARLKKDSLIKSYDNQVQAEKTALIEFKNSVSWQGKININDKTVSNTIHSFTVKIDSLEADKRQALKGFEIQSAKQLTNLESNNGFNLAFWFWLSMVIEVLIILCLFFCVWYEWNVSKENEIFGSGQKFEMDLNELQTFAHIINLNANQKLLPTNESKSQIGFQQNKPQINDIKENPQNNDLRHIKDTLNTSNEVELQAEKNRQFLRKYATVVDDIKDGLTYAQILKKRYDVEGRTKPISESTLINIKRVLSNL